MKPETLLLRQIHPGFVQNGRVSSQAFRPTPKDQSQLSVYNGELIGPEASWRHFTANPLCRSAGVMAVTRRECQGLGLGVIADGLPFPEHASIDFSGMGKSGTERKAKLLGSHAQSRGWLFRQLVDADP